MTRPNRQHIEACLNNLIVDIYVEPSVKSLERLRYYAEALAKEGYPTKLYLEMYQELKEEYFWLYETEGES